MDCRTCSDFLQRTGCLTWQRCRGKPSFEVERKLDLCLSVWVGGLYCIRSWEDPKALSHLIFLKHWYGGGRVRIIEESYKRMHFVKNKMQGPATKRMVWEPTVPGSPCEKCRVSGPAPDPLNLRLHFSKTPGDSHAHWGLRIILLSIY